MRPPTHLVLGFLFGAFFGSLVLLGPTRIEHLYCGAVSCPITRSLDDVCEIATRAEGLPPVQRASFLAREFSSQWPTDESVELAQVVGTSAPGEKYDAILAALDAAGETGWSCDAMTRLLAAPVAASMKHITVDGRVVAELEDGRVGGHDLETSALVIAPLYEALRNRKPGALTLGVHPALPFKTIAQIIYTAGLADHEAIDLVLLDLNVPKVRIALAPYGTCVDCLAELDEIRVSDSQAAPILAVLGRRTTARTSPRMLGEDALRLVAALGSDGDAWIAARGGVLAPRVGPDFGATVPRGRNGPEFGELRARLEQVRQSYRDESGVVVTADLETRASQLHRMLAQIVGPEPVFETAMLAIPVALFDSHAVIAEVFRDAAGVRLSTRGQLTRPVGTEAPVYASAPAPVAAPTKATSRRAKRRAKKERAVKVSRAALARTFQPHLAEVSRCYRQGLARTPSLAGRVVLRLQVMPNGRLENVRADDQSLGDATVARCIEAAAKDWRVEPLADTPVSVAYPLVLEPR